MNLDKIEVVNNIRNSIKHYCQKREILNIYILDEEWKIFGDELYEALEDKGLLNNYYHIVWEIFTDAFYESYTFLANSYPLYIIEGNKIVNTACKTNQMITISRLLDSLDILRKYHFRKYEIKDIYDSILEKCHLGEVIEFRELVKKR